MRSVYLAVVAVCASAGFAACGNVDKHIDCNKICNEYKDCYDEGYDVDECEDRCNNYASDDNDERQAHADECESCIDDKSCTEQAFSCATECESIVP